MQGIVDVSRSDASHHHVSQRGAKLSDMANEVYAKAIEIKNLVKRYKSVVAVNDITLDIYEGEIFGFLGQNGADKTTTFKTKLGLIFPSAGQVMVLGKPAGDIDFKVKVSYRPGGPGGGGRM